MSIKSAAVRCLSIAVFNVSGYSLERTLERTVSLNLKNGTFKIITTTVTEVTLIQVFFFAIGTK